MSLTNLRKNSRGFSHVEFFILIIFFAVIGSVGYYVHSHDKASNVTTDFVSNNVLPLGSLGSATNSIWSGYETAANAGETFTTVAATFRLPAIACPATPYNGTTHGSSIWVGLDGYTPAGASYTVEQGGVDEWCTGFNNATGKQNPNYVFWYEMFPKDPVVVSLPVAAGDNISAQVVYSGGSYKITLDDLTSAKSYTTPPQPCGVSTGCTRATAEWIVEKSYPAFGNFVGLTFNDASATVNGTLKSLGDFAVSNPTKRLVVQPGIDPLDAVSGINPNGGTFTLAWLAAQ